MSFSYQHFKDQFPLFKQEENRHLIYFDNAATTQKPQCVLDAMMNFYVKSNGNANRASHRLARSATRVVAETRRKAAKFIGAENNEIVFVSGSTLAVNIIANGLKAKLDSQKNIVVSIAEHHSNFLPWQKLAADIGSELLVAEFSEKAINEAVDDNTQLLAITAASNALGDKISADYIRNLKERFPNLIVAVDASQLVAHQAINVKEWACDFMFFSGHKMYGPTGIGVLYGKYHLLEKMEPLVLGGEMVDEVTEVSSSFSDAPQRFEAGTSSLAAIAGLGACIDFWSKLDRQAMGQYECDLIQYLHDRLKSVCNETTGLHLLTRWESNVGVAALASKNISMADLGVWLDQHDIAVRVGNHCAQPLLKRLGEVSTLRISVCAYNSVTDIDALIDAIKEFVAQLVPANTGDELHVNKVNTLSFEYDVDLEILKQKQPWQKKYKTIMQWGDQVKENVAIRTGANLIKGCESSLWLESEEVNGHYYFSIDSDSRIVKGLALLIVLTSQGKTALEIEDLNFEAFFQEMGLSQHLSSSRMNGLNALVGSIKSIAK